jgi:hypothetical protein
VAIDLVLLRLGWGLMAIAAGSLVTYFLYAAAVLWYVSGHFDLGRGARLRFLRGARPWAARWASSEQLVPIGPRPRLRRRVRGAHGTLALRARASRGSSTSGSDHS